MPQGLLRGPERHLLLSGNTDRLAENLARYSIHRLLRCCINREKDHLIGQTEARTQAMKKMLGSAVAMRLKDAADAPARPTAGGLQGCLDLRRMVPVILNNEDAPRLAGNLESPFRPTVSCQHRLGRPEINPQGFRHRNDRQTVDDVMNTRNLKADGPQPPSCSETPVLALSSFRLDRHRSDLGVIRQTVGHPPPANLAQKSAHPRIISAADESSLRNDPL